MKMSIRKPLNTLFTLALVLTLAACNTAAPVVPAEPGEETITMTAEEYAALQAERDAALEELAQLQAELEALTAEGEAVEGYEYAEYGEAFQEDAPEPAEPVAQAEAESPVAPAQDAQSIQPPAETQPNAAQQQTAAQSGSTAAGTGVFAGFTVNVYDQTTPAVRAASFDRAFTTLYFLSANDTRLGSISGADYIEIMQRHNIHDGGTIWFADHFNTFRSLGAGAREEVDADRIERYRSEVVRLVNRERERAGLPALQQDSLMMEAAQIRAREIQGNFSHTRPGGGRFTTVFSDVGAPRTTVAENIAMHRSPEEVMRAWMNSQGHRNNILSDRYAEIGVGVYIRGGEISWVQLFSA